MKFILTVVPMSITTRRRTGKAKTEVIDTEANEKFRGLTQPLEVEMRYERIIRDGGMFDVKVIDVRQDDGRGRRQW